MPANVKPVPPGVYMASAPKTFAAVGPALPMTLIASADGGVYMNLPGYGVVRGAMGVNGDGTLWQGVGNLVVHPDGTTGDANIVGTSDGQTLAGTINGSTPFSVSLTGIAAQPTDLSAQGGDYVSTSSSDGQWFAITLTWTPAAHALVGLGHTYATQADALALDASKAIYVCTASFSATSPANPNTFNSGFGFHVPGGGPSPTGSYGFAYFTAGGFVSVAANPGLGESMVAAFAKR